MSRFLVVLAVLFSLCTNAQNKTDTTTRTAPIPARPLSGPKPFKEVITVKAVTDNGLFPVHKVDEKYFFEIPDSLLGREILIVNRISKAAAGMRSGFFGYAGDEVGRNVIRFEKGPNNKLFIRTVSFAEYSKDSTSPMFTAVSNSNVQPITASFEIKAFSRDSTGSVIDVTDYVNNDNDLLFFGGQIKNALRIGSQQSDKSYITSIRSYPINIEISTVKTYSRSGGPGNFGPGGNLTMELNSSFVMLPRVPMQSRSRDPRVGYFGIGYTDFDANTQGVEAVQVIKRWRLEPRDEDMEIQAR